MYICATGNRQFSSLLPRFELDRFHEGTYWLKEWVMEGLVAKGTGALDLRPAFHLSHGWRFPERLSRPTGRWSDRGYIQTSLTGVDPAADTTWRRRGTGVRRVITGRLWQLRSHETSDAICATYVVMKRQTQPATASTHSAKDKTDARSSPLHDHVFKMVA